MASRWDGLRSHGRGQFLGGIRRGRKPNKVECEGRRLLNCRLVDLVAEFQARGLRRVMAPLFMLPMGALMRPMRVTLVVPMSSSMMVLLRGLQQAGICHPGRKRKQPYPQHHPRDGANPAGIAGVEKSAHVRPIYPMAVMLCAGKLRDIDLDQMKAGVNYAVLRYPAMVMKKTVDSSMNEGPGDWMTVGRLAKVAGVGVETIRYYQGRGLLPIPKTAGSFRHYPASMVQRIGFIKRAQSLGFSLDEVGSLLDLEDGRNRRAIQTVTRRRLEQIDEKVGDLERMRDALRDMLVRCEETGQASPCPIIAALVGPPPDPQPLTNRLR